MNGEIEPPRTPAERSEVEELAAVRRRFADAVGRWGLSNAEAARLLGDVGCWRWATLSADAEARVRLLLDVDRLLAASIGMDGASFWLREPNPAFVGFLTPLEAMSLGRPVVREVRDVLEGLVDGG